MLMNVTMELTTATLPAIASIQIVVSRVFARLDGVDIRLFAKETFLVCGVAL